jgi:hypothetical protein
MPWQRGSFGEGGVFNPNTPGAWSDSPKVKGSAEPYTEEFKECIALQAPIHLRYIRQVSRHYSKYILLYVCTGPTFRLGL